MQEGRDVILGQLESDCQTCIGYFADAIPQVTAKKTPHPDPPPSAPLFNLDPCRYMRGYRHSLSVVLTSTSSTFLVETTRTLH